MYIYELVESLIDSLQPDRVERRMVRPDSVSSFEQEQYPDGWQLYFNHLRISIQARHTSLCDYILHSDPFDFYNNFRFQHPYTRTAEVAVISCDGRWIAINGEYTDEYSDTIWAYADVETIEDIVKTIAAYSRQG